MGRLPGTDRHVERRGGRAADASPSNRGVAPSTSTQYEGEWLLHVPDQAYELATGEEGNRMTRYCFETFSNEDGWPHLRT
ncbi:hypothetical protein AB0G42_09090 [Streptomyces yangpuensis]|uniref:hypothetical protein n=1 Tax=Streptomyces yangpuensis TaxID=1648182 RepID=UPI003413F298